MHSLGRHRQEPYEAGAVAMRIDLACINTIELLLSVSPTVRDNGRGLEKGPPMEYGTRQIPTILLHARCPAVNVKFIVKEL